MYELYESTVPWIVTDSSSVFYKLHFSCW